MKTILFICTGNSARSIMAEVITNELAQGKYHAYSAGAKPTGEINPLTIETLKAHGHSTRNLSSKRLNKYYDFQFDTVITVCDDARESCPVWPKQTRVLHWSLDDPAAFEGSREGKLAFFDKTYSLIRELVEQLLADRQN